MAELTPLYMDISAVYSGDELGLPYRDILGEGVVGAGDMLVSQKAAGANLSVDIAAGAAWVLGDTDPAAQPIYRVRNDAVVNLGITPDPSNPRKAIVIGQIQDETFAGTGRAWQLQVIHGTPAATPAEPALPDSAIKLAIIDIAAGATSIIDDDITDTRQRVTVGGGGAVSGAPAGAIPVVLRNPQTASNLGNAFPTAVTLPTSSFELPVWEYVKDVDGQVFGIVRVGDQGLANPRIVLATAYNATTGVSRWLVNWLKAADGEVLNPSAMTAIAAQDITVPATAYKRKDIAFDLGTAVDAGDVLMIGVEHNGAHANDTVAVDSLLLGAWLVDG